MNVSKSGVSECIWVYIGSDGCGWMRGHGGEKKLDKKIKKCSRQTYFAMHVHNEKTQEMCRDGHGGQRGS